MPLSGSGCSGEKAGGIRKKWGKSKKKTTIFPVSVVK